MKLRTALAGTLLLVAGLGCAGVVTGDVTVDGQPFTLANCSSAAPEGLSGVYLVDGVGNRLRIDHLPGDQAAVTYLPSGGAPVELGPCGTVTVTDQNSEINGVTNVMGDAELSCSGAHTVAGKAHFENCH